MGSRTGKIIKKTKIEVVGVENREIQKAQKEMNP
jgi:hypothetical protein